MFHMGALIASQCSRQLANVFASAHRADSSTDPDVRKGIVNRMLSFIHRTFPRARRLFANVKEQRIFISGGAVYSSQKAYQLSQLKATLF